VVTLILQENSLVFYLDKNKGR